mgnify:CR=1 FL=1
MLTEIYGIEKINRRSPIAYKRAPDKEQIK